MSVSAFPIITLLGLRLVHTYSNLADLIICVREGHRISRGQLAKLMGYRNLSKGSRRIESFERGQYFDYDLIALMANALHVPRDKCELAWFTDWCALQRQWTKWIDEPITQQVIISLGDMGYQRLVLRRLIPTLRPAEQYASRIARRSQQSTWLIFSRRVVSELDHRGRLIRRIESLPSKMGEAFVEFGGFVVPGWTRYERRFNSKCHLRYTVTDRYGTVTYTNE